MSSSELLRFLSLEEPNVRFVVLGVMLISASTAVVGGLMFLRKQSLVGDAVAHSVLPGVCLAFLIFNDRAAWVLLLGAVISGLLSMLFIDALRRQTKLKEDTAIGAALSWFFAIGVVLLSYIQNAPDGAQSGLDKLLFGSAAAMLPRDVVFNASVAVAVIIFTLLLFRPLKLIIFDPSFAKSVGIPRKLYDTLLSLILVMVIASGIQSVGIVLMAALLITPAAAARFWTHDLRKMLALAGLFGMASGWFGAFISYAASDMPTGPWIVVVASVIALFSFIFGTSKGYLTELWRHRAVRNRIDQENLLKAMYQLSEAYPSQLFFSSDEINNRRRFLASSFHRGKQRLIREELLEQSGFTFRLTPAGIKEGARITRLHRLWEIYLTRYLGIAADHVHDDAEAIEHIITPEIEAELVELLDRPETDPHNTVIPYPDA